MIAENTTKEQEDRFSLKSLVQRYYTKDKSKPRLLKDIREYNVMKNLSEEDQIKELDRVLNEEHLVTIEDNEEELKKYLFRLLSEKKEDTVTEELSNYIKRKNYIYSIKEDGSREIFVYSDGVYLPNGESTIKEWCRRLLGIAYTNIRAQKVIDKIEIDTYIDKQKFFNTNLVGEIPVLNGILDLRNRVLLPFDPKKIFFNKIQAEYKPGVDCPMITKFISEAVEPDVVNSIFEIGGSCLWTEYFTEQAVMFLGEGSNAKGKLLNLFKTFLGIKNCSGLTMRGLSDESFDISSLIGKLANIAGDISNTDLKETGLFKNLTGRDLIFAKRKFRTGVEFVNFAKFIFACNELPKVYDNNRGWWRRWFMIEFKNTFYKKEDYDKLSAAEKANPRVKLADPDILNKIITPEEMSGFLNKCLDGLDVIRKNGHLTDSRSVQEIRDLWIRKSDSFMAFAEDCLEENEEGVIKKAELRKIYSKYCKKHKLPGCSDKSIKITLESQYGATEGRIYTPGEGYSDHTWEGISFKPYILGRVT